MKAITYNHARENLTETMCQVGDDHTPVIITRQKERAVVMISLEDCNACEETAYLFKNPANAARLRSNRENDRAGKALAHDPMEND